MLILLNITKCCK